VDYLWLELPDIRPEIFREYAFLADLVISNSEILQKKLLKLEIESIIISIGLEKIYVSLQEKLNCLDSEISLLHAGKLQHKKEFLAFSKIAEQLAGRYNFKSYQSGKYKNLLVRRFKWIDWYNFPSSDKAVNHIKSCIIGIIIRYKAHNPARLYYHASMLQPIIAIGDYWTTEVKKNKIGIVTEPENIDQDINIILNNYKTYLCNINKYAKENLLDKAYDALINFIQK